MIEYLQGELVELTPTSAVVDVGGTGYFLNISFNTFELIKNKKIVKIYVHEVIREDSISLYGFGTKQEREMFRLLLTVSGVGPSTARLMLSSLTPEQIEEGIIQEDVGLFKNIKGIGQKTAQRIIVDLKDKVSNVKAVGVGVFKNSHLREEAVEALVTLGFNRKQVEKVVDKLLNSSKEQLTIEELIKQSFKFLT